MPPRRGAAAQAVLLTISTLILASCLGTLPVVAAPSGSTSVLARPSLSVGPPSAPVPTGEPTALPTVLATPQPLPPGPSSERLTLRPIGTVPGAPLGYAEYLPPGYGSGSPAPLLIFLHGVGSNGDGTSLTLRRVLELGIPPIIESDAWPADRPFVVLMPQHNPATAGNCPDAAEIDAFLKFAIGHYNVDDSRIYLTGLSCGAIGAWDYLAVHGTEIVAAAVLAAGRADSAFAKAGCLLGLVPVWAFHGAADPTVPLARDARPINALEACTDPAPVDLHLTIYPHVGHDSWTRTYDLTAGHDVYAWLLQHQLRPPPHPVRGPR